MVDDVVKTGAPIPFEVSGKTFQARTLTDLDHETLNAFVQKRMMDHSKLMALMEDNPVIRKEMLSEGLRISFELRWGSAEGAKCMANLEGTIRLAFQMLENPTGRIKFAHFDRLFRQPEWVERNIVETDQIFGRLNPQFSVTPDDEDNEESPEGESFPGTGDEGGHLQTPDETSSLDTLGDPAA